MDDRVEYPGNWKINGSDYFGTLVIVKQKGIIRLILHNRVGIDFLFDEECTPDEIQFIRGELIPYGIMCLVNSRKIRTHTDTSRNTKTIVLDCEYCVNADFNSYEEMVSSEMEVRFSNTFLWSGLNGVKIEYKSKSKNKNDFMIGKDSMFTLQHEFKNEIKYSIDKNTTISFVPYFHDKTGVPMTSEDITISQYIKVKIKSNINYDLFHYVDILDKVRSLIEMGIQQNTDIREIKVYNNEKKNVIHDKTIYTAINVFSKNSFKDEYKEPDIQDMLFSLTDEQCEDLFQNWFSKYDKLKPIIELFREIIDYEKLPINRAFLNVVQALEYYHAKFVCSEKEQFQKDIEERYQGKEILNYLWDKDQIDADYIIVKNRILDLFCMSNLTVFDPYVKTIRFVNSVVNTRHYLTHYGQEKELKSLKDINLQEAYFIIVEILKFYILKELGFEELFIKNKIQTNITRTKEYYNRKFKSIYGDIYECTDLNFSKAYLAKIMCKEYSVGKCNNVEIINKSVDIDLLMETNQGSYKVKIFNKNKSDDECMEYIKDNRISNENRGKGIRFHKIQGKYIYKLEYGYSLYRICVSDI